eukprot:TRINITY_DN4381_c1_g1_i2.p4 TRINITY_DN4381_c1_g1~~TRINITY_DN4381_c1_g1_i2.p4  ORF type:complete len:127 (-),score=24.55 TRINITY_DN4381_c1_g1_i2:480-860(-)
MQSQLLCTFDLRNPSHRFQIALALRRYARDLVPALYIVAATLIFKTQEAARDTSNCMITGSHFLKTFKKQSEFRHAAEVYRQLGTSPFTAAAAESFGCKLSISPCRLARQCSRVSPGRPRGAVVRG